MLTNPAVSRVLYIAAVVLNYGLTAFAIELGKGNVPIPTQWQWIIPILSAVVTALLMFLPRYGGELIARQVDRLKSQGVRRRDMQVREFPAATARREAAAGGPALP